MNKNMDSLRNFIYGHFKPKIRIPDIIYLSEGLQSFSLKLFSLDLFYVNKFSSDFTNMVSDFKNVWHLGYLASEHWCTLQIS